MGENKSGKLHVESSSNEGRKVLGDVTNQLGNREFSSTGSKQLSGRKRVAESCNDDEADSRFWKQVSMVVDKLDKEIGGVAKYRKVGCVSNEVGLSPLKGGKTYRLQTSSVSGNVGSTSENRGGVEVKEDFGSSLDCAKRVFVDVEKEGGFVRGGCEMNVGENRGLVDVEKEEGFMSGCCEKNVGRDRDLVDVEKEGVFMSECCEKNLGEYCDLVDVVNEEDVEKEDGFMGESCEKNSVEVGKECRGEETRVLSGIGESDCYVEVLGTRGLSDNGKSVFDNNITSSFSESAGTSRFGDSREVRSFGLERCTLLKGDGSNSVAAGVDLLKNCSCSFCTKAAYIWSDLQCQDVNGRISILAKSQKEASKLARMQSVETAMGEAQGSSSTSPHLETGLATLWKSLFLHMENNFAAESSQLQSNFAVLKNVREDYKLNLEMMNAMPPDIHQCSSDASDRSYDKPGS